MLVWKTSLMERLKPLFPLDPRFNQGRNQYPWEPRGKVTGYASLLSPRPPPQPPDLLKKTKKTSGNSRRKRLKMEKKGHVTSWRWKVILHFLCGCLSVGTAQNLMYPSVPSPITHFPSSPLLCSSSVHTVFNFLLHLLSTSSIPPVALFPSSSE